MDYSHHVSLSGNSTGRSRSSSRAAHGDFMSCGSIKVLSVISFEINLPTGFENTGAGHGVAVSISVLTKVTTTGAGIMMRLSSSDMADAGIVVMFVMVSTTVTGMMMRLSSSVMDSARSFWLPTDISGSMALKSGIALVLMSDLCAALDLVKA